MAISTSTKSKGIPRRRIIERPRLIKMLDETDARMILLLAPAGYGKTTLAEQWTRTLQGLVVSLRLSASHRDVASLADAVATQLDSGDSQAVALIRQHLSARRDAQQAASHLGIVLAEIARARGVRWIYLDDYHEVSEARASEELIRAMLDPAAFRLMVGSRTRPSWVTGRQILYGDVAVVTRDDLAMTEDEVAQMLGRGPRTAEFVREAAGWPAVIGLAASVGTSNIPPDELPIALHDYFADELFGRAAEQLQEALLNLALYTDEPTSEAHSAPMPPSMVSAAIELGFSARERQLELHPLMREFLLEKLANRHDSQERVRAAVEVHTQNGAWAQALDLVVRFGLDDLVETVLARALPLLVRAGRVETIRRFVGRVKSSASFPPPSVDVARAEIALRDGNLELARDLAARARARMAGGHNLATRASAILGQVAFLLSDFEASENFFEEALLTAEDERDETEALRGRVSASVFGERPGAANAVDALRCRAQRSPVDFIRYVTADLLYRRFGGTPTALQGSLGLDAARESLLGAEDPIARTAMTYGAAAVLCLRADYANAIEWLELFYADAREFGLDFALPYADWAAGMAALGLRRFRDAERALQSVEDATTRDADYHHQINALTLRARLLLQSGDTDAAIHCVREDPVAPLMPSWRGEYFATRSLVYAVAGRANEAASAGQEARSLTMARDVQFLARVAEAISLPDAVDARELIRFGQRTGVWDPLVCGLRSSLALADCLAADPNSRRALEDLYARTNDFALARRAGIRTRATARPTDLLSPRELEVIEMIARGMTNREISRALYIADSTTKVHVHHILEKLGVRTRTEAVARLEASRSG